MVYRDFILPEFCKLCPFISYFQFAQFIVHYQIKEALISYRTKTYKLNRIKAYEVFKNVSCDRIAKFAPTSLEDLKALRCLDEAQITLYGQDIIEIVKQVLNK